MFNSLRSMSLREKTAWISLLTTLIVFIPYFVHVVRLIQAGRLSATAIFQIFIEAVLIQIVLVVVAAIVVAVLSRQELKDERDKAIELKALRNAYWVLTSCSVTGVGMMIIASVPPNSRAFVPWLAPTFVGQAFLFFCVAAEITKQLTQIISYRRGV